MVRYVCRRAETCSEVSQESEVARVGVGSTVGKVVNWGLGVADAMRLAADVLSRFVLHAKAKRVV